MCAGPLGGRCNVIFRLSHGAAGGCLPRKEDGFAELALSAFTGSSLTRLTYSPFGAGDAQKPHATDRLWLAQGATRDAALRLPHDGTLCPRHSRCTGSRSEGDPVRGPHRGWSSSPSLPSSTPHSTSPPSSTPHSTSPPSSTPRNAPCHRQHRAHVSWAINLSTWHS